MGCGAGHGGGYRFESPGDALAAVRAAVAGPTPGAERVPLATAAGRVLAESVIADRDSPAMDVSAMDGFALRASDVSGDPLPVAAVEASIGRPRVVLPPGAAVRIVTGAPVPTNADTVIKREDVEDRGGFLRVDRAVLEAGIRPGLNIRRRGENAAAGAAAVRPGAIVTAAVAGSLGAFGVAEVAVRRRVRVAILTTGDELVGVGDRPEPWQLRDSNGWALRAMLAARAWIEPVPMDRVKDEPAAIAAWLREAVETCDAAVMTGGVSMGDRDFVPRVVSELGATVLFHKLPQRPGKPMLAAITSDGVPIFGLPGNPVSVMVTARRMVLPTLAAVSGAEDRVEAGAARPLANPDESRLDLWWHRLVREGSDGTLELVGGRGSGDVVAAAGSSGFIEVPPGGAGLGPWAYFGW